MGHAEVRVLHTRVFPPRRAIAPPWLDVPMNARRRAATRVILVFVAYMVVAGVARLIASHLDVGGSVHIALNILFNIVSLAALVIFIRALRRVERLHEQ